jgi:outer membrane biosynthesis protein TonB
MNLDGLITLPTFRPDGRLDALWSGGGSKPPPPPKPQPIKFPKMPEFHMPPPPPPAPPPAPPPTATSADVAQSEEQARRDAQRKKGLRKTVLAGETGGYGAQLGGGTILGGPTGA